MVFEIEATNMNKKKSFINVREILITLVIALLAIIIGSINRTDLEVTKIVYNYENPSMFGIFFSVIGAVVLYFISVSGGADPLSAGYVVSAGFSTYYINLSIFLAFAAVYPDMQVMLFFVLPVRIKWLGIIYVITVGYQFVMSGIASKFAIVMSLLNFILFFFSSRDYRRVSPKEIFRRQQFKRATSKARSSSGGQSGEFAGFSSKNPSSIAKHKCAICGRTDKDYPSLDYRFCSKCNGNYEYCSDHLFTHEHVQ